METLRIKDQDYNVKPGMKAIIVFEKLTDNPFSIKNTTDILTYIYSAILAGNPGTTLDFDAMLDAFDEDPTLMEKATAIVLPRSAAEKVVQLANEGGPEPKKD